MYKIVILAIIISFVLTGVMSKAKVSGIKIMLLGIALITFSSSVLNGMVGYGLDGILSILGFCFCITGFFKKDK